MPTQVLLDDLEHALLWVSSSPDFETEAFVSRTTGKVYLRGVDGPIDDEFPEDIDDGLDYIACPHENDLDLGRDLVFRFVSEHAVHLEPQVRQFFRRKGAYAAFKDLLSKNGLLDRWHEYERLATRRALEAWAAANGFTVAPASGGA